MCEQRFQWVPAYGGQVPPNAVCGGQTSDGERLYIGRAYHEGSSTVGKVTNLQKRKNQIKKLNIFRFIHRTTVYTSPMAVKNLNLTAMRF